MKASKNQIAIVDDDSEIRSLLQDFLISEGYEARCFSSATEVLNSLQNGYEPDVILSDIKMPEMTGLEFTKRFLAIHHDIPIILMTAFGTIETAIEAMHLGAFHYVVKPFKLSEISAIVKKAVSHRSLHKDNLILRQEVKKSWTLNGVIGKSPEMKGIFDLVGRVSHATANILIMGESGTGKEVVARAIHQSGPRAHKPFVAINCTAIPDTLLESELFGHAKGSFTGAIQRKKGLFEEAEGGTLFLDEIGDMNILLQSKLLRVIQERRVRAVGENVDRPVDVRIIAATHKDLKAAIREGRFREDLYYRLSVIPIQIPALRERRDDIPLLAEHFLRKYTSTNGTRVTGFTKAATAKLMSLPWEGNVRELENVIERAVVLATGSIIDASDIPSPEGATPDQFYNFATRDFPTLEQLEKRYIKRILEKTGGRKDQAAQILGISRRTLYRKEREYGFVSEDAPEDLDLIDQHNAESDSGAPNLPVSH